MKPVTPMGASTYHERRLVLPCYVQPKLDGVRCITNGKQFFSRNGNEFGPYRHLQLRRQLDYWVDGELYIPGRVLGGIVSVVKRRGHVEQGILEFHAFDIVDMMGAPFKQRLAELRQVLKWSPRWKEVRTDYITSSRQLHDYHKIIGADGGEGTIIRDPNALYGEGLWKWKFEQDAEFEIVDVKEGKGKDKGTPIFQCKMKKQRTFWVRPMGSMELRRAMWRDRRHIVRDRTKITVRFAGYTADGIPFHPRGLVLRNYE